MDRWVDGRRKEEGGMNKWMDEGTDDGVHSTSLVPQEPGTSSPLSGNHR